MLGLGAEAGQGREKWLKYASVFFQELDHVFLKYIVTSRCWWCSLSAFTLIMI